MLAHRGTTGRGTDGAFRTCSATAASLRHRRAAPIKSALSLLNLEAALPLGILQAGRTCMSTPKAFSFLVRQSGKTATKSLMLPDKVLSYIILAAPMNNSFTIHD